MGNYALRKSRRVLRTSYKLFQRKKHRLSENEQKQYEAQLRALDQAVLSQNKEEASGLAKKIEAFNKELFPKSLFDHARELVYALGFAIVVAFFIRQFWFELYEVPTGSMRPTVMEPDRMVVSSILPLS
jgi:signal peptidase I